MAAKYTASQKQIITRIKAIGAKRGASPKEIKAALETGAVESNFQNLAGGDADSAGWRQERASEYKNPTNLDASINRFYDETAKVKSQYGSAGALAAAVQRPAAQYRGRYQADSSQAQALLGSKQASATAAQASAAPASNDAGFTRQEVLQQYLAERGQPGALTNLSTGLATLKSAPKIAAAPTTGTSGPQIAAGGGSKLLELFWQGPNGINAKNGKAVAQGVVEGHTDHVHVAAGPKTVVQLGKLAQSMGLHVGENPHFGKVNPVHVPTSYHYKGEAIDVSGDTATMSNYAHRVAKMYGIK